MEGRVVLPEGLFFSGLFRGAEAGAGSNTFCPWTFSPSSLPLRLFPPQKPEISSSYKHDRTVRGRHAPGSCSLLPAGLSCDMWPFLCSIIILNESRESVVDLFVSRSSTICSRVAVRFTSLSSHMELRLARVFVGGSVWAAHHAIFYSSWQIKDAIRSAQCARPSPINPSPWREPL